MSGSLLAVLVCFSILLPVYERPHGEIYEEEILVKWDDVRREIADHLRQSLVAGLTSSPKYIPAWYNYDDVGSRLQQESGTINRDYYLTRSTISVLKQNAQDIVPIVPYHLTLMLLRGRKKHVDGVKLILWIGSVINLQYDDQVNTLRRISTLMTDKCRLVFSADITQDKEYILKAYNDETGLTRTFIQYGVARLNKEEGSHIDIAKFIYELDFISNKDPQYMSYVRAYLQAKEDARYPIPGLQTDLVMEKGERLYFHEGAGLSCKYTLEQLQNIVKKAGLRLVDTWVDGQQHAVFCGCVTV